MIEIVNLVPDQVVDPQTSAIDTELLKLANGEKIVSVGDGRLKSQSKVEHQINQDLVTILYISEGNGTIRIDNSEHRIKSQDKVVIKTGNTFTITNNSLEQDLNYTLINVETNAS